MAHTAFQAWLRDSPPMVAADCETTGLTWSDLPFGVTIAWSGEQHYFELGDFVREVEVAEILARTPTLILHNAKFDFEMLLKAGCITRESLNYQRFHDTETIAHLLDENRPHGLKPLAKALLGRETDEQEALKVARRKLKLTKDDGFHLIPREVLVPYAITDARFTFDLFEVLYPQLIANPGLLALYDQERKLTLTLLDMEWAGLGVDEEYVTRQVKEYGFKLIKIKQEIVDLVGREDFKANSPKQVIEAFAERGITLEATGEEVLKTVSDPLAEKILELRKYTKLRSTYLVPMLEESIDGILHPSLRQHGTRTGRMSSGAATNN